MARIVVTTVNRHGAVRARTRQGLRVSCLSGIHAARVSTECKVAVASVHFPHGSSWECMENPHVTHGGMWSDGNSWSNDAGWVNEPHAWVAGSPMSIHTEIRNE